MTPDARIPGSVNPSLEHANFRTDRKLGVKMHPNAAATPETVGFATRSIVRQLPLFRLQAPIHDEGAKRQE